MKLHLSQEELQKLYEEGKTCVWAYKDRYCIRYSITQKMFELSKIGRFNGVDGGVTKRREFIAVTPEEGYKMENEAYHKEMVII